MTEIEVRKNIIGRINDILEWTKSPIVETLGKNIGLFSNIELSHILKFLETGSLNPIYDFLENKKGEYLALIEGLKAKKKYTKINSMKIEEQFELEKEMEEADEIIDFEF